MVLFSDHWFFPIDQLVQVNSVPYIKQILQYFLNNMFTEKQT